VPMSLVDLDQKVGATGEEGRCGMVGQSGDGLVEVAGDEDRHRR
jgi:hypothetical protein